ncbi:ATP-binding protein [Tolypothrix campylonemoides VB511288]|nr:ATP-binding protein [Tolypothrix campylonemoides VB511288]
MNTPPRLPTLINTASYPTEFLQVIQEKSQNFVDRQFVFTAITNFLHRYNRGYFTIVGAPGSGKSAILAKYVTENPHVVYYNAQLEGKNRAEEFLTTICTELIRHYPDAGKQYYSSTNAIASGAALRAIALPDKATEGSWFLSLLLQKISDQLEPHQRLIIAIDGLSTINHKSQSPGSNLFYLPRYLPDKVYFLLTRRPFLREKSGLLIEAPSQTLDLAEYPEENREDVQAYIQRYLTPLPYEGRGEQDSPPLAGEGLGERSTEQEFIARLTAASENNFMYLSQILPAIAEGFYPEPFQVVEMLHTTSLVPPGLVAYYQSHWQKMKGQGLPGVSLGVLRVLVDPPQTPLKKGGGVSAEDIAQIIDEDEFDIEEVLENWLEFLQMKRIEGKTRYSLYHSSFRNWLTQQLNAA